METKFIANFENLFDISHSDTLGLIKVDEDTQFLISQRKSGRRGSFEDIDRNLGRRETRCEKRTGNSCERTRRSQEKLCARR